MLRQGDLGQEFALIVSGEADVVKDGETVARLGPGAYFGEIALVDGIEAQVAGPALGVGFSP